MDLVALPAEKEVKGVYATRETILSAASSCIGRFGSRKTSMADIALAAKIGRQTLYRHFSNKEEIIEAVFIQRVMRYSEQRRALLDQHVDIEDQILNTFLGAVKLVREDKILANIVLEGEGRDTELFLIGTRSPLHSIAIDLWTPLLERAASAGQLRNNLSIDIGIQYVRAMHFILHIRTDMTEEQQMEFAKGTVLVSLLADKTNKYA